MKAGAIAVGVCLLYSGSVFAYEKPTLIDLSNTQGTQVKTSRVNKKGWPWGWVPQVQKLYVGFAGHDNADIIIVQHYKKRKKWGKPTKCKQKAWWADIKYGYFECPALPDEVAINKTGVFSFKVSYKQPLAGKITPMGERFYNVLSFKVDQHVVKKRWIPSIGFVVDQDFRMPEARVGIAHGKYAHEPPFLYLFAWFKGGRSSGNRKHLAHCYFGGKKIQEQRGNTHGPDVEIQHYKKKGGSPLRTEWHRIQFYLHSLRKGVRKDGKPVADADRKSWTKAHWLDKNPGDYKCLITVDGDLAREIHFTIDKDQNVVKPACQTSGAVVSVDDATLVRQVIKKAAKYNKKAWKKWGLYLKGLPKGCPE
jgi:hypothetical protein